MNQCNPGETELFGLVTCYPNSPITVAERLVGNLKLTWIFRINKSITFIVTEQSQHALHVDLS